MGVQWATIPVITDNPHFFFVGGGGVYNFSYLLSHMILQLQGPKYLVVWFLGYLTIAPTTVESGPPITILTMAFFGSSG